MFKTGHVATNMDVFNTVVYLSFSVLKGNAINNNNNNNNNIKKKIICISISVSFCMAKRPWDTKNTYV